MWGAWEALANLSGCARIKKKGLCDASWEAEDYSMAELEEESQGAGHDGQVQNDVTDDDDGTQSESEPEEGELGEPPTKKAESNTSSELLDLLEGTVNKKGKVSSGISTRMAELVQAGPSWWLRWQKTGQTVEKSSQAWQLPGYGCPQNKNRAGIAERVSALDWLSLRYAAIITLPVSNPGLCP